MGSPISNFDGTTYWVWNGEAWVKDPTKVFDGTQHWSWNGIEWAVAPPPALTSGVAPKSGTPWLKPLLVVTAVGVMLFFASNILGKSNSSNLNSGNVSVVYEVTGSAGSADITYSTASGISQQSDLIVPLKRKSGEPGLLISVPPGTPVVLSAQNKGESGTVTCTIKVNGSVVSTNTSSGAYVIASCSGLAE